MPIRSVGEITVSAANTAAVTACRAIPLDIHKHPFAVSFFLVKSGAGTGSAKVQHTGDNIFDPDVSPTWFDHADVTLATGNVDGNYAFPVRAVRVASVSASASNTWTLTVIQAG